MSPESARGKAIIRHAESRLFMNFTLLSAYLATIALLIATPGPVVALVLSSAAKQGLRPAILTAFGTNAASLILIGTAALAISGLIAVDSEFLTWISLFGCLFLAWIALRSLRGYISEPTEPLSPPRSSPWLRGFLVGISNPKDILFFVAFFPQFVGITGQATLSLALMTLLWVLFDITILIGYARLVHTGLLRRRADLIARLSAGFLLLVACSGFLYAVKEVLSGAA